MPWWFSFVPILISALSFSIFVGEVKKKGQNGRQALTKIGVLLFTVGTIGLFGSGMVVYSNHVSELKKTLREEEAIKELRSLTQRNNELVQKNNELSDMIMSLGEKISSQSEIITSLNLRNEEIIYRNKTIQAQNEKIRSETEKTTRVAKEQLLNTERDRSKRESCSRYKGFGWDDRMLGRMGCL